MTALHQGHGSYWL